MLRLAYYLYRLSSSIQYRLGRRLTAAGWLALIGVVLCGFVGIDLDQSVASQTFALLFCLLLVAMVWGLSFRGRFRVERRLPRFGSVGRPFTYRVSLRDAAKKARRELELFEDLADPRPTREEYIQLARAGAKRSFRLTRTATVFFEHRRAVVKAACLPAIPPRGEAEASVELLPLRRGPLRFLGVTVAQSDPLGLFRGFVRVRLLQTVLILPRRYPLPAVALPGTHKYQQGGIAFAASVGESEEFVSLRDYRPGDPLRHVHWRSSARTGRLEVKEFEDEFFVRHALVLDTFGTPAQAQAFEEAVSVAASFASTVETQESLLDLMFVGAHAVCFTMGRGVAHAEQALEILASVQLCQAKLFNTLQALVLQHAPLVSGCICIFLKWDEARRELVRELTALGVPLRVLVVTDEIGARELAGLPPTERPANLNVLEVGKIETGLNSLETFGL